MLAKLPKPDGTLIAPKTSNIAVGAKIFTRAILTTRSTKSATQV